MLAKLLLCFALFFVESFAQDHDCCIGPRFQVKTEVRALGTNLFQNVSIDYQMQALRSDEAGIFNNTQFAGTAWIFGPSSSNGEVLFWLNATDNSCSKLTYTWTESEFCTNDTSFVREDRMMIAGSVASVWYSAAADDAIVIAEHQPGPDPNACSLIQWIDNYSNTETFEVSTFWDFFPRVDPSVFTPCTPTSKADLTPIMAHLARRRF